MAGFNLRSVDAWRSHPLINNTWRHSMPGLGLGLAAFAVYVAYDKLGGAPAKEDAHH